MNKDTLTRWVSLKAYGLVTRTLFGAKTPPRTMRARFERFGSTSRAKMLRRHPGLVFDDHRTAEGLAMESVSATPSSSSSSRRVILYLHGGAFVMGSTASYRSRATRLSYRCQAEVFVPDYRLAPDHPYPAALDDALSAYRYLKALHNGVPVFIAGDSAGGGLALSLLIRLRELGETLPDAAILLSPWTDLRKEHDEDHEHESSDLWLSPSHLNQWAEYYVGDADPMDPCISPSLASFSGLPPLLLLVGEHELIAKHVLRLAERARQGGTEVELIVGKGMQHDWPLTLPWLPESRHAWKAIASFVEQSVLRSSSA